MTHHNQVLYITGCNLMLPSDAQRKGRSSPLGFIKFRCPADMRKEGVIYNMAVESIKLLPEGERVLLVFYEILRQYGGNKIAALRGWLVNHHLKVASAAEVAQTIGFRHKTAMVGGALKQLVKAGLLEWRDPPDFQENLRKDKQVEVVPREPRKRDLLESGKFGQVDNRPDGREAAALVNRQADDRPQGREADSDDRPDGREGLANEGKSQSHGRQTRKTVLPSDGLPGPPDTGRKVSGKFPDTVRGTSHARLETRDLRPETGDGRPQTPPAAPAAPPPLSAHGYGKQATKDPAPAAPSPEDGGTGDGIPAPAPAQAAPSPADGLTPAQPTNDQPTLAPQGTQAPPDGPHATGNAADGLSAAGDARPSTGVPPSADDAPRHAADREQGTAQAQANGHVAEPPEPTKADPGLSPTSQAVQAQQAQPAPPRPSGIDRDMTWHAEKFAEQILIELYPSQEELVKQGRLAKRPRDPEEFRKTELASFVTTFQQGLAGLNQVQAMQAIEQGLKMARGTFRKKPKTTRGRLWSYDFRTYILSLRKKLTH